MRRRKWLATGCLTAAALLVLRGSGQAECGEEWSWSNPLPTGSYLLAVAANSHRVVAVGVSGTIVTSTDGTNFTLLPPPTGNSLYGIAWSGTHFVAVGQAGTVLRSADGVTWEGGSGRVGAWLQAVIWWRDRFVAVGDQGSIATSQDGVSWGLRPRPTTADLLGIAASPTVLVAVGKYGAIVTSQDGMSWEPQTSGTTMHLEDITWSGSQFVAVGQSGTILTSPNGLQWTAQTSGLQQYLLGVAWHAGRFVAVGSLVLLASHDGVSWTRLSTPPFDTLAAATGGSFGWVAVGRGGAILTSGDGSSWQQRTSGATTNPLMDGVWVGHRFLVVGRGGTVLASEDGVRWSSQVVASGSIEAVAWSGQHLVAVGGVGILRSTDGTTWVPQTLPADSGGLVDVVWTGSQWLAVGGAGAVLTSPDGEAWTKRPSGTERRLNGVTWTGRMAVAVGENGTILTSPDGASWTQRASGTAQELYAVGAGGGKLVAVGARGTILESLDGASWTSVTSPSSQWLFGLLWTGSGWLASGSFGAILASPDGSEWRVVASDTTNDLYALVASGQMLLAVGQFGAILRSVCAGQVVWVPVASHAAGAFASQWRTDLGVFNPSAEPAQLTLRFHGASGVAASTGSVAAASQAVYPDVVAQFPATGSGALEIVASQPVVVTSRTYNLQPAGASCYPNGTLGQNLRGYASREGLAAGETGYLLQLAETAAFRTNIALTNSGPTQARATVTLFDGAGRELARYDVVLAPGEWKQENRPFASKAGQSNLSRGYARITVGTGSGVLAYASVVDNVTNDPTTVELVRWP